MSGTIVDAFCDKGKCIVGWRECQNNTYLVDEKGCLIGNYIQHESGITQWLCKKFLECKTEECKENVVIELKGGTNG